MSKVPSVIGWGNKPIPGELVEQCAPASAVAPNDKLSAAVTLIEAEFSLKKPQLAGTAIEGENVNVGLPKWTPAEDSHSRFSLLIVKPAARARLEPRRSRPSVRLTRRRSFAEAPSAVGSNACSALISPVGSAASRVLFSTSKVADEPRL